MNKKQTSKQLLEESLKELLMKQSIEKITVEDIVENCGVSRPTFYRHFRDKYELMNHIYYARIEEFLAAHPDPSSWKNLQETVSQLLYENAKLFKSIISFKGQDSFESFLYRYGSDYCINHIKEITGSDELSLQDSTAIKVYIYGTMNTYFEWLNNDCPIAPDTLSKIMSECIPHPLRKYFI